VPCLFETAPRWMVQSTGNSIYNGMTAHLKHVFGHGFNFDAAYTFGKAIDDADVVGSSTSGNPTYVDVNNRALERGPTGYDVRQKLAFSGVWQLPFFKGQSGIAARALGHWEFTGIGILQSGTPIDVTSSASFPKGDWNADGQNGDRPDAPGPVVQRNGFSRSAFLTGIFTAAQFPSATLGADGPWGVMYSGAPVLPRWICLFPGNFACRKGSRPNCEAKRSMHLIA
jgi:hypothetical protein